MTRSAPSGPTWAFWSSRACLCMPTRSAEQSMSQHLDTLAVQQASARFRKTAYSEPSGDAADPFADVGIWTKAVSHNTVSKCCAYDAGVDSVTFGLWFPAKPGSRDTLLSDCFALHQFAVELLIRFMHALQGSNRIPAGCSHGSAPSNMRNVQETSLVHAASWPRP